MRFILRGVRQVREGKLKAVERDVAQAQLLQPAAQPCLVIVEHVAGLTHAICNRQDVMGAVGVEPVLEGSAERRGVEQRIAKTGERGRVNRCRLLSVRHV